MLNTNTTTASVIRHSSLLNPDARILCSWTISLSCSLRSGREIWYVMSTKRGSYIYIQLVAFIYRAIWLSLSCFFDSRRWKGWHIYSRPVSSHFQSGLVMGGGRQTNIPNKIMASSVWPVKKAQASVLWSYYIPWGLLCQGVSKCSTNASLLVSILPLKSTILTANSSTTTIFHGP